MRCAKVYGALDPIASTRWLAVVEGALRINKANFALNFLHDSAKMWWEGKVYKKGKEWIGACTWKENKELFNAEFTPIEEIDKNQEELSNECPNPKAIEAKPLKSKARMYMMTTEEDKVVHDIVTGIPPERQVEFRIDLIPGLKVDPAKTEAVMNWQAPKNSSPRKILLLCGVKRRKKLLKPSKKLCKALILVLSEGTEDMVVYSDTSYFGLECVLMRGKVIAYASRQLKKHEENYLTYDLEFTAANVVADALSQKEREKIRRILLLRMIVTSDLFDRIKAAQVEALKEENWKNRDGRFTSIFWREFQEELGMKLHMSTAFHPQMDGQSERTIQTLEDMLRAYLIDFRGSRELANKDVVLETTEKIETIHERLKEAQDRFRLGKVHFGSRIKENLARGKCLADESSVMTLDDVEINPEITNREETIVILGRKTRQLRNKEILLVKVQWKHHKGTSIRWEPEEKMRIRYPHLFQE
uniref:Reverse transcriptase/retrotransposon-derived protein RNase H-like domain-containing protein n=1 Tax=Tanacetum cinerariifolium TaxID=118510 RepID=A0A6L2KIB9_TANCI|nr:hypothetical protein [Tanacetum cinerariifolium]GEW22505.1 hypothetical protein [Tanacetum cinerariifolium]